MRPNTSTRPNIRSCDRSSPEKIGAGVTSTKSNWTLLRDSTSRAAGKMPALLKCGRFRQGQPDLKTSVARFGVHLDAAAVLLHDSLHGIQSEPGSFANTL